MTDTFIISEVQLRNYTDINDNVDTALIKNAIREAQDIGLQAIIGTILYDKILSDIDSSSLSGVYKTLVDNYIQDYLIYAAYWYSLDAIYLRPRNNGIVRPTGGENAEGVERDLYNVKRQSVRNKMEYYAERLTNYILEEENSYPELSQSNKLYEQVPDYSDKYGSPFVFNKNKLAEAFAREGYRVDSRFLQFPNKYN